MDGEDPALELRVACIAELCTHFDILDPARTATFIDTVLLPCVADSTNAPFMANVLTLAVHVGNHAATVLLLDGLLVGASELHLDQAALVTVGTALHLTPQWCRDMYAALFLARALVADPTRTNIPLLRVAVDVLASTRRNDAEVPVATLVDLGATHPCLRPALNLYLANGAVQVHAPPE